MPAPNQPYSAYIQQLERYTHTLMEWFDRQQWAVEDATMALLAINSVVCLQKVNAPEETLKTWIHATATPLAHEFLKIPDQQSRATFLKELTAFLLHQATETGLPSEPRWNEPTFHDPIRISPDSLKLLSQPGEPALPIETKAMELAAFLSTQHWTSFDFLCVGTMFMAMTLEEFQDPQVRRPSTMPGPDHTLVTTSDPNHLGFFFGSILTLAGEARFDKPNKHRIHWEPDTKSQPDIHPSERFLNPPTLPEAPSDGTFKRAAKWNEAIHQIQIAVHRRHPEIAQRLLPRALAISETWPVTTPYHALTQALAVLAACQDPTNRFPHKQWEQVTTSLGLVETSHSLDGLTSIVLHLIAVLREQEQLPDTVPVLRTWLYTMERFQGPLHQDTLLALHELTETLIDLYQFTDAFPLTQDLMRRRESTCGATHPDTLKTMNNLASQATHLGQFDEAERLLLTVLAHTDTRPELASLRVTSRDNLASIYAAKQDWVKAISHYEQLVQETSHLTGPRVRERIPCLSNLANAYMSLEKFDKAAPFQEEAYELTRASQQLGTLEGIIVAIHWAIVLQALGRHPEATPVLEALVPQAQRTLGPNHPETLHAQLYLAANLESRHQTNEAEQLFRSIISTAESTPDDMQPILRLALQFLVQLYEYHGRHKEAVPYRKQLQQL